MSKISSLGLSGPKTNKSFVVRVDLVLSKVRLLISFPKNLVVELWKIEIIRFLGVGGANASLYFILLLSFILLTGEYYLAVGVSQIIMAIIAYINFSWWSFGHKLNVKKFLKFCLAHFILFCTSSALVFILVPMGIAGVAFVACNVLVLAPLSYVLNSTFVFR